MNRLDITAWVSASRAAQGLPEHITDPAILARVADIFLGAARDETPGHHSGVSVNTNTITITTTTPGKQGGHRDRTC